MSVAKNDEVCTHQLGLRLGGEPVAGVPIKKRPVLQSDKSVPSGMPLSMKPSSNATAMSASGAGCNTEPYLNRSKSDIPNRSFLNGSSDIPSRGGSVAPTPIAKSQSQKFLTLDLQLASRQNVKINSSSPVKKEKVDQGFSMFPSARPSKDVQTSAIESPSDSSLGKLSNLDLNVSLHPVDQLEALPTMHAGHNALLHTTFQHQKAQVPPVAPFSATSSRLSMNIDSTLNLSNAYDDRSNNSGAADVTLDLQLKPPTRPELGISWKGLAPDPELSLSLSGNHTPKGLNIPDAIFASESVGVAKIISGEIGTPGSDKSPVKKILKPVPCNANHDTAMPSIVSGSMEILSSSMVKKEPEEPQRHHIQNNIEKAPLFDQQSVRQVSKCAEFEKTCNTNPVCGKAGFDLNSGNFPNNSIRNGLEVVTDTVPVQTDNSSNVVCTENMPAVSDVGKFIKHEEVTTDIPSTVITTISGQSSSIAKPFLSEGNIASPAVRLSELVTQPTIYASEPAGSNPVKSSNDCKPTASLHSRENVTRKRCDTKEACDVSRSSSNPTAESLAFKSLLRPVLDGMSQGSASMDCSDDVDNAVSQLPTTSKPHAESLVNSQITETKKLSTELQKEDSDMHHDCSSVTNKVHIQGIDDVKRANSKDVTATHSVEEHESEVSVNGKYKGKQLLTLEKNFPMNNTDVAMQDVNIATCANSADLRRSPALGTSGSPKIDSTRPSHKKFDNTVEKSRMPVIKSERSQSPDGKQAANCSEGNGKIGAVKSEHGTENEDIARASNLQPSDSVVGEEDSHLDGASSSQPHDGSTKVQSASERSENEKSKPDSSMTSSVQNEKDGQVNGSHWREVSNAYVNRNERWERFMKSEREKGEYHGGRQAYDMNNQRRMDHRYGGRGGRYHGHPRNFRGPRMNDDSEIDFPDEPITGRRRPFENDFGHLHRIPHRRLRSPPNQMPGFLMRGMEHDPRLQMDDMPDEMMEERFFAPHPHQQHALGDHEFIHRDRSHSPGQRRGAPMHFHRGRSPETMHRSPPLNKTDRPYLPHQRHMRRRVSPPFDRVGHDERGMQRNMRRCGMHQGGGEADNFEPPLHPAQLAELHAEAEHTERRKFGERRPYRRSLEVSPVDDEEMLSYHGDGDMEFADGDGGPREPDGRYRNRPEHRSRGEQEDGGYKYRGPQGCRGGGNSNDTKSKKRRY